MTIAPELPGAVALVKSLAAEGVLVSLGHSDATAHDERADRAAVDCPSGHRRRGMSAERSHCP